LVKFLAAPIHPADVNMVQGTYGHTVSSFPAVAGIEGVGVVEQVGKNVNKFKLNQRVIPAQPGLGTWRTHAVVKADHLETVSEDIPIEYAAILSVNPCTAYRLLNDFVDLREGDVIIQNGSNSMVGLAVIQMAKMRGIKTINIIRERANLNFAIERLKELGADIVVTDKYANTIKMNQLVSDLPKPKLALNCIGGPSSRLVARFLGNGGTMVTYGGMSHKPVTIPTSAFIFNDITLKGFWLSRWVETHSREEKQRMLDEITTMIKQKKLVLFTETFKFSDFPHAVNAGLQPMRSRKVVLKLDE
jgi:trans-2-enoyl-CoA reductase